MNLKKQNKKLTLKQQEWIRQTIITKNPTEAVKMVYRVKDNHNASVMASENLAKPYLREAVNEGLEKYNLNLEDTVREHKWVIAQKKDLATKLKGIQEHYDILGMHSKEKQPERQVNVGIFVSE